MAIIKQCDLEQLESWRPSRTCCLFMNAYSVNQRHPKSNDLEDLSRKLSGLSFEKRLQIRTILLEQMQQKAKQEDYFSATRFKEMLLYYEQHVM